jgi:uncharacterized protein (DUF486 family)
MDTFAIFIISAVFTFIDFFANHWWQIFLIVWGIFLLIVLVSIRENISTVIVLLAKEIRELKEVIEKHK